MLATHEASVRLETTAIGLGLVRLLQDAKRFEEARAVLFSLEDGCRGDAEQTAVPERKPCKRKRANGVTKTVLRSWEAA